MLAVTLNESAWATWQQATCLPSDCFCEAARDAWFRQPANSWTSLVFVVVGIWIGLEAYLAARNPKPQLTNLISERPMYSIVLSLAAIYTGLGSWFFHASLTFVGQFFDLTGMYFLASFALCYAIARILPQHEKYLVLTWVFLNILLTIALLLIPAVRRELFGGLVVLAVALELIARRKLLSSRKQTKYFLLALCAYGLGQMFWILDAQHIICTPSSLWQLHIVWHVLSAATLLFLFWYYRCELGTGEKNIA